MRISDGSTCVCSSDRSVEPQDSPPQATQTDIATADQSSQGSEIVVTGIRSSLERAAEVKQNSVQVVDSFVAQDISKFPDPTVASSLQRVAGVQVSNDRAEARRVGKEGVSTCRSGGVPYN